MSSPLQPSTVSNGWSAAGPGTAPGPSMTGPFPQSTESLIRIPIVNNLNLLCHTIGNLSNVQPPGTLFPQAQQPMAPAYSVYSNNYASPNGAPSINPSSANVVCH